MPSNQLLSEARLAERSRGRPHWMPLLLVVTAGALALLPAVINGVPNNPDLANHYHFALPFYEAIRSGNFHPGWLGSSNYGFGDPIFRFYPPGLYYLLAAARMLTGNWYVASLLVLAVLSMLGALAAYFWANSFLPRNLAVVAGALYAFTPYHVAEVYQAAQLAEYAAGAALLFALGFVKRICDQGRRRDMAGLAASYSCLILTHLPLAVIGSLSLLVYGLLCLSRERWRANLLQLSAAVVLGLASTAFYWTTVMSEMKWIVADGPHPDALLDYRANFIFSTFSPEKSATIWWMNLLMIATLAMFMPAVVLFRKATASDSKTHKGPLMLLLFSVFMATSLSRPVWALLKPLQMTQHPFRWLSVTSAVVPVLLAASIPFWQDCFPGKWRPLAILAAGLVAIVISFTVAQPIRDANYLSAEAFARMIEPLPTAPGINQWLPVWATSCTRGKASYEKATPPAMTALAEAKERSVTIKSWESESRTILVGQGPATDLRVHTFYYPHWIAKAGGQILAVRPATDGAMLISLPPQAATIEIRFAEPSRTYVCELIGLGAVIAIGLMVLLNRRLQIHGAHES